MISIYDIVGIYLHYNKRCVHICIGYTISGLFFYLYDFQFMCNIRSLFCFRSHLAKNAALQQKQQSRRLQLSTRTQIVGLSMTSAPPNWEPKHSRICVARLATTPAPSHTSSTMQRRRALKSKCSCWRRS